MKFQLLIFFKWLKLPQKKRETLTNNDHFVGCLTSKYHLIYILTIFYISYMHLNARAYTCI